jgi:hypothetical protein
MKETYKNKWVENKESQRQRQSKRENRKTKREDKEIHTVTHASDFLL